MHVSLSAPNSFQVVHTRRAQKYQRAGIAIKFAGSLSLNKILHLQSTAQIQEFHIKEVRDKPLAI